MNIFLFEFVTRCTVLVEYLTAVQSRMNELMAIASPTPAILYDTMVCHHYYETILEVFYETLLNYRTACISHGLAFA